MNVYLGINHIEKILINHSINYGNLNIGMMKMLVTMVMKILGLLYPKVLSRNS